MSCEPIRPWTCAEQRRFAERWGREPPRRLCREHRRTLSALYKRAGKLHLISDEGEHERHPRVAALLIQGRPWEQIVELTGAKWQTICRVAKHLEALAR